MTLREGEQVRNCNPGDLGESLTGKESLVSGNQDIWEGKETSQFIVMQDLTGQVLKKDTLFLFVDVEPHPAELTALQGIDQCPCIDERSAADINDNGAGFHQLDSLATNDVMSLRSKRSMKRDDLALAREGARVGIFYPMFLCPIGLRKRIVSHYSHSKPAQDFRRAPSNLSGAQNPGGFTMKIETDQTVERKVEIVNAITGARDFAIKSEKKRDRVFGNSVGGVSGDARDREAKLFRRCQIHAIEPGTAQGQMPYSQRLKALETWPVGTVINEKTDSFGSACRRSGFDGETRFEEAPVYLAARGCALQ